MSFFPDDSRLLSFPLELHSRRITAVMVDHSLNVLEPVFCIVTEQQLPSTIHQRTQVDEKYRTKFQVLEFLATTVLSVNRHDEAVAYGRMNSKFHSSSKRQ